MFTSFAFKCSVLIALGIASIVAVICLSPLPQPPTYSQFADTRTFLGIPNALNVLSNALFVVVGLIGFGFLCRIHFRERIFYLIFFIGVFFTGLGSAYYHWVLSNVALVWDRIPITIAIMALFSALIAERVSLRAAYSLIVPLLIIGIASVLYWYYTELAGQNDVGPYVLVQVYPALAIALILWMFKSPYSGNVYLWFGLVSYIFARVFEIYDRFTYALTHHTVSGHTLKHVFAAVTCYCIYLYLARRKKLDA